MTSHTNNQPMPALPPEIMMMQMITGSWVSQSIYAVAKLGIADLLKDGSRSCEDLAQATGVDAITLYRVMRATASLGIFSEIEPGVFTLTPLAIYLQSNTPQSLRAFSIMMGEEHYQAWGNILHSVKTGESAFEHLYGMNAFEYYQQNPEPASIFDQAMTSFSSFETAAVVETYDFSGIKTLVDVGGGHGSFLTAILQAHPTMQGILFDVPYAIASAKPLIENTEIADRCQLVSGDFFTSVPAGGDAYIMKHIIHDWDDQRSVAILQQCRQAMADNGRVLLVEQVIPPGNDRFIGKLLDINMLVMCPGGRERTAAEYQTLFTQARFKLSNIFPTSADVSIVEAVPV